MSGVDSSDKPSHDRDPRREDDDIYCTNPTFMANLFKNDSLALLNGDAPPWVLNIIIDYYFTYMITWYIIQCFPGLHTNEQGRAQFGWFNLVRFL